MAIPGLRHHHNHELRHKLLVTKSDPEDLPWRWRPRYHIMPVKGWMNDPCAPGYNSASGLYTLSFQWNPKAAVWGNISWGSATSADLVNWTISTNPSMQPDAHDPGGVFTGTLFPGTMDAFYTSAQRLPINYKLPYYPGSERLHCASSHNSGVTWHKSSQAVLSEPPDGLDVTGWRDPFVGQWTAMDLMRGDKAYYGMLSGGIRNKTPTIFLYHIDPKSPSEWHFVSSLINIGLRFQPSRWTGNYGVSWEVASVVTLTDQEQKSRDVLLLGAQGLVADEDSDLVNLSANNKSMWMCGDVQPNLTLKWKFGGTLDHGCFYAASGFQDPLVDRFVVIGWIFEEDLSPALTEEQTWSGCLSLPRALSLRSYKAVEALSSDLTNMTCFELVRSASFGFDVTVLTTVPDNRLEQLRLSQLPMVFATAHAQLEISLRFAVDMDYPSIGFELQHSTSEKTRISFCSRTETITVDRSMSSLSASVTTTSVTAPHTLFRRSDHTVEDLSFHIYYDTSVLEIFINDRTTITTRVYPSSASCSAVRMVPGSEMAMIHHEVWSLGGSMRWQ